MSEQSKKTDRRDNGCGCSPDECIEKDRATQKAVNKLRVKYCDALYTAAGEVGKLQTGYYGETAILDMKKCMFLWTEENYRRYRNTDICLGTELIKTSEMMKTNVAGYKKLSDDLSASLKKIFEKVKDMKSKMGDLRTASCRIENDQHDSCSQTQWAALTGKPPADCNDKNGNNEDKPHQKPVDTKNKCNDIDKKIKDIICMPKALVIDADSVFKSSSEIIGIQVFSNVATLDPLQKTLSDNAKEFETHLKDVTKLREDDMKKLQDAVVKSESDTANTIALLYSSRSDFDGLKRSTKYFCCPVCGCVTECDNNCKPRLHDCECEICRICGEVKDTFCSNDCAEQLEAD